MSEAHIRKFHSCTRESDGCWEWQGSRDIEGYGRMFAFDRQIKAHRIAFHLSFGALPEGKDQVCHKSDNPSCVRPDHLFAGDTADNLGDMARKGRSCKGDKNWTRMYPHLIKRGDDHPSRRILLWAAGEKNGNAKLTADDVRMIRSSSKKRCELAAELNVTPPLISAVIKGKIWKHVA